jgi:hypothetical protein
MFSLLKSKFLFDEVQLMIDDATTPIEMQPTKENILIKLRDLVSKSANTDIVFTYAGHGSQLKDSLISGITNFTPGDEKDNLDETIVPLNYLGDPVTKKGGGQIRDDELKKVLLDLHPTARFTGIFDSCHSGSILDLPFLYNLKSGGSETRVLLTETVENTLPFPCPVMTLSGCRDDQTSMSAYNVTDNVALPFSKPTTTSPSVIVTRGDFNSERSSDLWQGAMSWALLVSLEQLGYSATWPEVFSNVRSALAQKGYSQLPMLASNESLSVDVDKSSSLVFATWERDARITPQPLPRDSSMAGIASSLAL